MRQTLFFSSFSVLLLQPLKGKNCLSRADVAANWRSYDRKKVARSQDHAMVISTICTCHVYVNVYLRDNK